MTPATTSAAGQDGAGLLPARPLAAQAHALRAAAAFIERTGLKGLSVTADSDGIYISVPRSAGSPATRTGTVTYLAVLTGAPCPQRTGHQACGPPRAFRTADLELFHAARCRFRYSVWTSCGVL